MDELFENGLGLAAALFVAACVLGVLWGKDGAGQPVKAVGDRVACGLFAMPLIAVAVYESFPGESKWWSVAAPLLCASTSRCLPDPTQILKGNLRNISRGTCFSARLPCMPSWRHVS